MLKFHNDLTVNESERVLVVCGKRDRHFSKTGLVVCGKREDFGRRRRKNEIERKRRRREYRQYEN